MIKRFKEIKGMYIEKIVGQDRLSYAMSDSEDLYDLVEFAQRGGYQGSIIIFYDFSNGEVYRPFEKVRNVIYSKPEYVDGFYYFLQADYGNKKKISLPDMNARINALLEQSIKSTEVINLFSDVNGDFSLFDPKFLEEIGKMKEKNLAVELLKKLIAEQVVIYKRTNVVKSQKFSEIIQQAMNRYLNGMLTNEQVIEELLNLAKQIQSAQQEGQELGLTADELAFYDALTKPQAIKDFYENEELIAITKELADALRTNRTIDWQKRDSARARMRMMIKKLLKKHKYPPEGMDDAVQTVMLQCELWTDNNDMMGERVGAYAERLGQYLK